MVVQTSPQSCGAVEVLAETRRCFVTGRTRSLEWRREQLLGIERLVSEQEAAIAEALAADLGRSAQESWLGDIASTKAEAAYARSDMFEKRRKMMESWAAYLTGQSGKVVQMPSHDRAI